MWPARADNIGLMSLPVGWSSTRHTCRVVSSDTQPTGEGRKRDALSPVDRTVVRNEHAGPGHYPIARVDAGRAAEL